MAANMQIHIAGQIFVAPLARDVMSPEELEKVSASLAESIADLESLSIGLIGGSFLALGNDQLRQAVFVLHPY